MEVDAGKDRERYVNRPALQSVDEGGVMQIKREVKKVKILGRFDPREDEEETE